MDSPQVVALLGIVVSFIGPFITAFIVLRLTWAQGTSLEFKKEHAALMQNMEDSRTQIATLRRNNAALLRIVSELPGADIARILDNIEGWEK